jgi:hypothetical protein
MKTLLKAITGICFVFMLNAPVLSQGNTHKFEEANLTIWFPESWKISEHGLHFLMPKEEDMSLQFELVKAPDFDKAVKISEIELKAIFSQEPSLTIEDIDINGMPAKHIDKVLGSKQAIYYILKTPEDKYVRFFCIGKPDDIGKHVSEISKIMENVKLSN